MMILSRFCLLLVCCGICLAVDSLDGQSVEVPDQTTIFDVIYGCFEDKKEDLPPCVLYQRQIDCLKPHSGNRFVDELLEGLGATVRIYGCPVQEEDSPVADNAVEISHEKEENAAENEIDSDIHHRERRMFKSPCQNYKHPRLDNACANWMFNNYHLLNSGWAACSTFKYNYTKPCGWYWAKCKRANRNHHCCISVHCHGNLG